MFFHVAPSNRWDMFVGNFETRDKLSILVDEAIIEENYKKISSLTMLAVAPDIYIFLIWQLPKIKQ